MTDREEIPTDLAGRLEMEVTGAAKALFGVRRKLREAAGKRSFLGEAMDDDEALARYAQIRHNQQGWTELLLSVARIKEDGRVLLPKELVETTKKFETRLREGEP